MSIKLDERLFTCAQFVRENAVLADIGTDHAYLPVYLLKQGKIRLALCCDINEKPLLRAKATVNEYGVADEVILRLCDGLSGIEKDEFSDLVIAGMGGEMIIKILSDCPYIKNDKYNLILQPMTKAYDLRRWLAQNGFLIKDEKCAESNGKLYTVINTVFCENNRKKYDEKYFYFGEFLKKNDENSQKYKQKIKASLVKKAKGILSADSENKQAKALISLCEDIENF